MSPRLNEHCSHLKSFEPWQNAECEGQNHEQSTDFTNSSMLIGDRHHTAAGRYLCPSPSLPRGDGLVPHGGDQRVFTSGVRSGLVSGPLQNASDFCRELEGTKGFRHNRGDL